MFKFEENLNSAEILYDEATDISDSVSERKIGEAINTGGPSEEMEDPVPEQVSPVEENVDNEEHDEDDLASKPSQLPQMTSTTGDEDETTEGNSDNNQIEGSYNASDYDNLDVNSELKELFTFITRYTPQSIDLENRLRPYIPDYIPAVGDIDAFIKIRRPDGGVCTLGLTVLDEPSAKQSDQTVLDLQLRAVAKHNTARSVVVKRVSSADKNSKVIDKWIKDISELHRAKPPPTVHYLKRMPDVESLMQEWPEEIEELLKELQLPSAILDLELPNFVDIVCGMLDVPIYKSRIQSLHLLLTLFSAFKNSAHFKHLADENLMANNFESSSDRLVLQ